MYPELMNELAVQAFILKLIRFGQLSPIMRESEIRPGALMQENVSYTANIG